MKRVLLALSFLLLVSNVFATNYWWIGGTSSANEFRDRSNWSSAGVGGIAVGTSGTNITFTNTDVLTIDGSNVGGGATGTVTVINAGATVTIGQLILTNSANFRISSSGSSRTYNIGGGLAGTDLDVQANSTLVVGCSGGAGTSTITFALTANNTASIAGVLDMGNKNSAAAFTIGTAGNATVASTGTYRHGSTSGTFPIFIWSTGSTCEVTGIVSSSPGSSFNQSFYNLIWNCSSQSQAIGLGGNLLTIAGDFTVSNTSTFNVRLNAANTNTTTVSGNLIVNGGSLALNSGNGSVILNVNGNCNISAGTLTPNTSNNTGAPTINLNGDLNISGTGILDFQLSGNTNGSNNGIVNLKGNLNMTGGSIVKTGTGTGTASFNFAKTGTQIFSRSGTTSISGSMAFVINTDAIVDFGTSVIDGGTGTFVLSSGAGIITANTNATGALTASTANGTIQVSGARNFNTAADYTFNGSASQVTGDGLPATVNKLTIANSSGVTLTNSVSISNNLSLNNGTITLGSNNLTLSGTSSTITGPSFGTASTNYVVTNSTGSLIIQNIGSGGRTGNVLFPVGPTSSSYNPVRIDNTTGAMDNITVGVTNNDLAGVVATNSVKNSWTISDATPGGNNATVSLQWNSADENASFTRSQSGVVRTDGSSVNNVPTYGSPAGSNPYSRTSETGVSSFAGNWGVTSLSSNPTVTLNTSGYTSNFGNVVTGTTSSEKTYTVSGSNLTADITITAPTGFQISATSGSGFGSAVTLTQAGGSVAVTTIYVRYAPSSANGASGSLNITNASTGAVTQNIVVSGNALAIEPTNIGSITFGTITATSVVVNLPSIGNGNKRVIVIRQGSAVNYLPVDGAGSTGVNANFTSATDQANGNKIVYDGNGSGASVVTVTGLSSLTTYHFAVYEYNEGTGTSQNYFISSFATANTTTGDGSLADDHFRSIASGNWNASATWESSHDGTNWITPANIAPSDASAKTITIKSGHTVTLTADVTTDQLTIENGGQLTVNNSVVLTVADGTGTDVSIVGYLKNSGTVTINSGAVVEASTATSVYEHNLNNMNPPAITWLSGSTLKFTGTYSGQGVNPTGRLSAGSYQNVVLAGTISIAGDYISLGDNVITIAGKLTVATSGLGAVLTSAGGTSPTVAEYEQTSGNVLINRNSASTRSLTVSGNATISGGVLNIKNLAGAGAGELNIGGTLNGLGSTVSNSGTAGSAVIRFNGSGTQSATFGTMSGTINYIINKASGNVSLGSDLTANGTVTFTAGNIVTGSNQLVIASTGSIVNGGIGGWVIGNLQKNVATGATTRTYEVGDASNYRPVNVAFGNVTTAGDLMVSNSAGDHPQINTSGINALKSVNASWTLANNATTPVVFDNYSATFNYVSGDVDAGAATASFVIKRYSGAAWSATTVGTLTATSSQVTTLTSFGDFAIGEVAAAPTVSTQPVDGSVCVGGNKTFTAASTSLPAPIVQWQISTNNGTSWIDVDGVMDGGIYSGFTTGTLTITGAGNTINNYQYRAVFTNINGSVNSNAAVLTVRANTSISSQPTSPSPVCVNGTAPSVSVTAAGGDGSYTYQWYSNSTNSNTGGTIIPTGTASSYTVPVTSAGTIYYYVVVTGSCGSAVTSNAVSMVVRANTSISSQPTSPSPVCVNGTAPSVSVTAAGGDGSYTYQWYSNSTNSNTGGTIIPTGTASSYTVPVTSAGTVYYYVVVTGSCGSAVTSNAVSMVVRANTSISSQPTSPSPVCVNGTAPSVSVTAAGGDGSYTYQWYSNSTNSNTGGMIIPTATSSSYTVPVTGAGTVYYYVVVTGSCGSAVTSNAVSMVVRANTSISSQPTSPSPVCVNGTAPSVSVTAAGGDGSYTYQWYSNSTNSNTGGTIIPTGTASSYTVPVTSAGTIYYYVVVTGSCGSAVTSNAVSMTVNAIPTVTSVGSGSVCSGVAQNYLITSGVFGATFTWSRASVAGISNSAVSNQTTNPISESLANTTNASVNVTYAITPSANGCTGNVFNYVVAVRANTSISSQPTSPTAVCRNGTAPSVSVTAAGGDGSYTYQWYSNTTNSNTGGTIIPTATASSYTVPVNVAGTTYYYVVVTGSCGIAVTSNAVSMVVNANTSISGSLTSPAAVCVDGTAPTLSVIATGTAPFTYQWYSNTTNSNIGGVSIGSATSSSYTLPVNVAGTVYYYVIVTGSCGFSVSNTATMVVNANPTTPTITPVGSTTICAGGSVSLGSSSATGNQWYVGGNPIGGATSQNYSAATPGTYTVIVTTGSCSSSASTGVAVTVNTTFTNSTVLAGTAGGGQVCGSYNVASTNNFFNNCNLVASVTPGGASAISGAVTACVTINTSVPTANSQPYVQRYYNVSPVSTTATSTITLYFTQAEFTAYNAARGTYPSLPIDGTDAANNKANLRISQFTSGSGFPYPALSGKVITPGSVTYNASANNGAGMWSVTFSATGTGAFYAHTGSFVLPVTIVNFRGEQSGTTNKLFWSTSTETNNKGFELERSADGMSYSSIAFVASKADRGNSTTAISYGYDDSKALAGVNYYRLKQIDNDGKYNYSNVVVLTRKVTSVELTGVYPNPATRELNVKIVSPQADKLTLVITDLTGKAIMQQPMGVIAGDNQKQLNISTLAAGTYVVKAICANGCETAVYRFVKQ